MAHGRLKYCTGASRSTRRWASARTAGNGHPGASRRSTSNTARGKPSAGAVSSSRAARAPKSAVPRQPNVQTGLAGLRVPALLSCPRSSPVPGGPGSSCRLPHAEPATLPGRQLQCSRSCTQAARDLHDGIQRRCMPSERSRMDTDIAHCTFMAWSTSKADALCRPRRTPRRDRSSGCRTTPDSSH